MNTSVKTATMNRVLDVVRPHWVAVAAREFAKQKRKPALFDSTRGRLIRFWIEMTHCESLARALALTQISK